MADMWKNVWRRIVAGTTPSRSWGNRMRSVFHHVSVKCIVSSHTTSVIFFGRGTQSALSSYGCSAAVWPDIRWGNAFAPLHSCPSMWPLLLHVCLMVKTVVITFYCFDTYTWLQAHVHVCICIIVMEASYLCNKHMHMYDGTWKSQLNNVSIYHRTVYLCSVCIFTIERFIE